MFFVSHSYGPVQVCAECLVQHSTPHFQLYWNIPQDPKMHTSTSNVPDLWPRFFVPRAFNNHSIAQLTWHSNLLIWQKEKMGCLSATLCLELTLRIRLKSSLSTLKKWQLSSRKTIEAALGASFTSANLPKSSPSCRVQTTPWRGQNIQMQVIPEMEQTPTHLRPHSAFYK